MMLHPKIVRRAVYYGLRWRLKKMLRIPDRLRSPVLDAGSDSAFVRQLRICRLLKRGLEQCQRSEEGVACEIGSGDCLATADLFLRSGFAKVYLVEKQAVVVDERQERLLTRIFEEMGVPGKVEAVVQSSGWIVNREKIVQIEEYFESVDFSEKVNFIFSHDVVEHVEDLGGFFGKCFSILKPGGIMVHKFDLSGHEFFEDPLPPLDFQTYSNWLYEVMFPKYRRSCRYFLDEITAKMEAAGFERPGFEIINSADEKYVEALRPLLRKEASKRSTAQLMPLDVVVIAKRLG